MKLYYITFRSVTFAQQAEKLLSAAGYRCAVRRTPRWMEEQGCGYCLRLRTGDPGGAVAAIRAREIPMRKVYGAKPDGGLEELTV